MPAGQKGTCTACVDYLFAKKRRGILTTVFSLCCVALFIVVSFLLFFVL
jgi:hypothetical protein